MARFITSLVIFLAAGGVFFWFTMPTYAKVQSLQGQIAEYDTALNKAQELQQLKQSLLARYNTFAVSDIDRLQKMLPDHVDNIALILDLDSIATAHGMLLENIDVNTSDPKSAQVSAASIGASSRQKYDSITMHFTLHSNYQEFEKFLADLETSLRIVDLVSLDIKQASNNAASAGNANLPAQNSSNLYQYDLAVRTYWLK